MDILIAPNVEVVPGQVHAAVLLDGLPFVIMGIADNNTTLRLLGQISGGVSDNPRLLPFDYVAIPRSTLLWTSIPICIILFICSVFLCMR